MVTSAKCIVMYLLLHGAVRILLVVATFCHGGNLMFTVQPDPSYCEQCGL